MSGSTTKRVGAVPSGGATSRVGAAPAGGSSQRVVSHDAYNPWGETWFGAADGSDCWGGTWEVGKEPAIGSTHTKRVDEAPVSS